jgi:hypothetical protein
VNDENKDPCFQYLHDTFPFCLCFESSSQPERSITASWHDFRATRTKADTTADTTAGASANTSDPCLSGNLFLELHQEQHQSARLQEVFG